MDVNKLFINLLELELNFRRDKFKLENELRDQLHQEWDDWGVLQKKMEEAGVYGDAWMPELRKLTRIEHLWMHEYLDCFGLIADLDTGVIYKKQDGTAEEREAYNRYLDRPKGPEFDKYAHEEKYGRDS